MVNINWEELCEAIGDYTQSRHYFLNKLTGEILVLSEFMSEATKMELKKRVSKSKFSDYVAIPTITSRDGYRMMEEFIKAARDEKLKKQLEEALHKEAPFKRFKEIVLKHPEERKHWLTFRQEKLTQIAKEWLEKQRII